MAAVKRDGFIVRADDGEEIHFTPCAKSGNMRDKVYEGMVMRARPEYIIIDTREETE